MSTAYAIYVIYVSGVSVPVSLATRVHLGLSSRDLFVGLLHDLI